MTWRDNLRREIKRSSMSMKAVSRAAGKGETFVRDILNRDRAPSIEAFQAIAQALDVPVSRLLAGTSVLRGEVRSLNEAREAKRFHGAAIPEVDVRLAGGAGGADPMIHEQVPVGSVAVSRDSVRAEWGIPAEFLRGELHVEPGKAWITEVYGDSMYDPAHPGAPGSLYPGDRVIVDTADLRPSPPGPFALWDGTGLVVKMVEVIPGTDPARLRLSSRNPSYGSYEVTGDEARIIGRIRGRISAL